MPHFGEIEETGCTFEENAMLKATAASRETTQLVLADDSGLEVDALGGEPGVYSARYAGPGASDRDNIAKVIGALAALNPPLSRSRARFRCVLALAQNGEILATFSGVTEGSVTTSAAGGQGFGYDPIFVPEGNDETFAELGATVKNQLSHRARALAQLREHLTRNPPL